MYVEPITASEVRHNFNILKDKFSMFDPFCPDCQTLFCEPNDFTFVIGDTTTTTTTFPTTTTTTTFPTTTTTTTFFDTNYITTQEEEPITAQNDEILVW
jgi:hypothetical protein